VAQEFAGRFFQMDGRIWSALWNSLSYVPTVMVGVLAATICIGALRSVFWFVQLRSRQKSDPDDGSDEVRARGAHKQQIRRSRAGKRRRAAA
jgi:hypothetical protein